MLSPIEIIKSEPDFMVLNKPAGITVTKEGVGKEATVEDWLSDTYPELRGLPRCGIVHRLDKGTTGLLMVARNAKGLSKLQALFKSRTIEKKYVALAGGDLPVDGVIQAPIARGYSFGKWRVDPDGKEALTMFKTTNKYVKNGKIYSLIDINLKSGRTHQIRVHFSYLKWPLVGDKAYGGEVWPNLDHPFLQSYYLDFVYPENGQHFTITIPLAEELKKIVEDMDEL